MGRMLVEAVLASADARLAARSTCPAAPRWARTPAPSSAAPRAWRSRRPACRPGRADVLIDFTRPKARWRTWRCAAELGVRAVIGTTGFSAAQKAEMRSLASACRWSLRPT
jgi:4-hydroxy-tetrahydrodipicolinate reductase